MRFLLQILVILFLSACSDSTDLKVENLVTAKENWLENAYSPDYNFTLEVEWSGTNKPKIFQVSVKDGVSDTEFPGNIGTINGQFEYILESLKNDNLRVDVTYHDSLGYPTVIKVTQSGLIDGGSIIKVSKYVRSKI